MLKYLPVLFLFPYLFGFSPIDTSLTDIYIGGGVGRYVHQDCNGAENRTFIDAGVHVTSKIKGPFRIGGTLGGYTDIKKGGSGLLVFHPELALDFNSFALGTTGIRIGTIDSYNAQLGIFNGAPPFTGRGVINAGFTIPGNPPLSRLWIGTNVFPYNDWGIVLQPEFMLSENNFLFVTGRYGRYEQNDEWGISVGVRIRK